jgi:phosphoribosyl 1,2-cyclic phosphodiesterase
VNCLFPTVHTSHPSDMQLIVLGSGSTGNGYLLRSSSGEILIIETGISLRKLKESLSYDFDLGQIRGALISHSHKDHSGRTGEYLAAGLRCYTSRETSQEILSGSRSKADIQYIPQAGTDKLEYRHHNLIPVPEKVLHYLGSFSFLPFSLEHDVKCYGYLIKHDECGQVVFITDTLFSRYNFRNLSHMIIEANYSGRILDDNLSSGKTIPVVRDRVVGSHMSLETCKEFIMANDLRTVRTITLIHLSSTNSSARGFTDEIQQMTGKKVYVAEAGMKIDLNIQPF